MKAIKKFYLPIFLVLLILLGILLWFKFPKFDEFGLNFTTEMIGVFITVFIVDFLLKRREDERLLPNKIIAYQETSLLYNRFLSLFFELYNKTIKEIPPKDTISFLEANLIEKALYHADSNANANISPPQKLPNYIANSSIDLIERAEKILDKYSIYMDPKVTLLIHKCFVECVFISTLKMLPSALNSRKGLHFPDSLAFHVFHLTKEDIENFVELYKLLDNEKLVLMKTENNLRGLSTPEYISLQKDRKFSYRISDEKLMEQIKRFEDSRKK